MGELHLTNKSILHDMIRPLKSESKDIVCGGGDAGRAEQHVFKLILVISLSLSQAEQQQLPSTTSPKQPTVINLLTYN